MLQLFFSKNIKRDENITRIQNQLLASYQESAAEKSPTLLVRLRSFFSKKMQIFIPFFFSIYKKLTNKLLSGYLQFLKTKLESLKVNSHCVERNLFLKNQIEFIIL